MRPIQKLTILLGGVCLTAMALITCAEVVMRYAFSHPIFGSAEMVQMVLGILVFAGMFTVARERSHVTVSLFEPFFLRHIPRLYRFVFNAMSLLGVSAIAVILGWRVWDLLSYPESTVVLRLPMLWIVGGMTLLAALAILAALAAMRAPQEPRE
ncbi:TRAP transporter small permease [Pararhodobacter zhoushanensis]|uniref:TRAP transporter small permease protein n=1 Tax=Pararhodobacter zhoushanensis TaxID=2479545 RepID=A0ABT3GVC9_9RHOB|nr:TRAP transporter small permease [Pararhodobacter zhoushanensis]MCW1931496.1 TRAP transporter small permease subunit [Pararhodobacter zhoushanensis]